MCLRCARAAGNRSHTLTRTGHSCVRVLVQLSKHQEQEIKAELRDQVQGVLVRNTREALHLQYPIQMQQHTLVIV